MKVLVYGLGRSGGAAARLLRRQGHDIWTYDAAAPQGDDLSALGCVQTDTPLETPADLCVAAPGVPYDAPDLVALRKKGVETIGEVEWVYRSVAAEMIGITGTAGKTTSTRWLTHVLSQAGMDAHAGGNIDPALLEAPWPVLERHLETVVEAGRAAPSHVLNLGHGVPPETDPGVLTRIVDWAHSR